VADTARAVLLLPPVSDEEWSELEPEWLDGDAVAAFDGDHCVGHVGALRLDTTIPGGARLTTAGISRAGVLPSHTTRGLFRAMVEQTLVEGQAQGHILASARTAQAALALRFGFGPSGEHARYTIDPTRARPLQGIDADTGSVRLLDPDEILKVIPELLDRCGRRRVGSVRRPHWLVRRSLRDALDEAHASFVAVHEDATGQPDGYVHYDVSQREHVRGVFETGDGLAGTVRDLVGEDPLVERALWAHLFDLEPVTTWATEHRPVDDVIRLAASDPGAVRASHAGHDVWLRILDADIALPARDYGTAEGAITIQVRDPLLSNNSGTWRIDRFGAFRTHLEPDMFLEIGALSAVYLGGTSWRSLHEAGRIRVRNLDAVEIADLLFGVRPHPFRGSFH
jgi:predicted acetyltransferase